MAAVRDQLQSSGIVLPCGPFAVRLRSDLPQVAEGVEALYGDFPRLGASGFVDFEVSVHSPSLLRRHLRAQACFSCDGRTPFKPLPASQSFAMLEWGLNWVISAHAHDHLVLHAAAVERDGRVLLLAADPGSGKSTLCAALVHQGWRLLSDELALLRLHDGMVQPIARPISLKNESIEIVRALGEGIRIGPLCRGTAKGTVAHVRPPADSVRALECSAPPAGLVFPRYRHGAALHLAPRGKARSFAELLRHAFNLPLLATEGFDTIGRLLARVDTWSLEYGRLDEALPALDRLWRQGAAP